MTQAKIDRRQFVRTGAAVAAAAALPAASYGRVRGANEDLRVAVMGLNNRGRTHYDGFAPLEGVRVVALCDPDHNILQQRHGEFTKRHPKNGEVAQVVDYHELIGADGIDVVSIATPNHMHALPAVQALKAGQHVYCEKPVSHNVWEGRQIVEAARAAGRMCQCGTQSRSSPSLMKAVDYLRGGQLGAIQYAIGTCYKPRWGIGQRDTPLPIPEALDYDLWCGPAAKEELYRPEKNSLGAYNPHYDWHWDFNTGNGDLGNQGIHQMDIARWFLGEDALSPEVFSIGGRFGVEDAGDTPNTQIVWHGYEKAPLLFEVRGLPEGRIDGRKKWGGGDMPSYRGSRIGVIVQCEGGHVVVPSYTQATAFDADGKQLEKWSGGGDHFANFVQAVRSGNREDLNADILEGHLSSALCHTGNVSYRMGESSKTAKAFQAAGDMALLKDSIGRMVGHLQEKEFSLDEVGITVGPMLTMDPQSERFTGARADEANRHLARDYRSGFTFENAPAAGLKPAAS